jgi:hypothetical protein
MIISSRRVNLYLNVLLDCVDSSKPSWASSKSSSYGCVSWGTSSSSTSGAPSGSETS